MNIIANSAIATETDDSEHTELLRLLKESVEAYAQRTGIKPARDLRGRTPGIDPAAWKLFAEQGWTGSLISEAHGGQGLPYEAATVVARELARILRPEPFVTSTVFAATILSKLDGTSADLLTGIASGTRVVGVAWQSRFGGLDPRQTPVKFGGSNMLSGDIHHVASGMEADAFIVAALDGDELLLALVDAAGISRESEPRPDGTFSATLSLSNAEGKILARGAAAETALRHGIAAAAIVTAAELVGCMEQALEITIGYLKTRVQFDRPIGSFQALQHRTVDLYIQKELSVSVLAEAVRALDTEVELPRLEMEAARAKARCTHAALMIGRESIKLHGAIAYTDEYDVGLYLRRILSLAAFYGNASENRSSYSALLLEHGGALDETDSTTARVDPAFMSDSHVDVDWNKFSDSDFRSGVRAYFEAHYPVELRHMGRRGSSEEMAPWLSLMAAKRWIAPAWPKEHGGMGLDPYKQVIFIEERERVGIARNPDQGVVMFGPMLMRYGTDAQKAKYLPRILSAEDAWCQGYSEPNAGSDLASLRTEAVLDGEEYIINGSKIWTSSGHHATHMFLLARTDKTAKKQEGISFFILDLKTAGVTIRPITNIAGHDEFCEVFFDNVRVPRDNLVGQINKGWTVAKSLLGFERLNNGSPRRVSGPLKAMEAVGKARGVWTDASFREKYVGVYLDIADLKSNYSRFADIVRSGRMPGPEISQLKIWAGECAQRLSEMLIDVSGSAGGVAVKQSFSDERFNVVAPFYAMFPSQIASGSNDIQRNILSKRVLGLPNS
ncbi:acyl-CoA dehydrogenase [Corticibacterium sp. UT-5YL-CI-8]|nr:acyl-CoA dehydrogenase [Tianweitania sp. UT-5YL-CI-8]